MMEHTIVARDSSYPRTALCGTHLPSEIWINILWHLQSYKDLRSFIRASSHALALYSWRREATLEAIVRNIFPDDTIFANALAIIRYPIIPDTIFSPDYCQSTQARQEIQHIKGRRAVPLSQLTPPECLWMENLNRTIMSCVMDYWKHTGHSTPGDSSQLHSSKSHGSFSMTADHWPTDSTLASEPGHSRDPSASELLRLRRAFYIYELSTIVLEDQGEENDIHGASVSKALTDNLTTREIDGFYSVYSYIDRHYRLLQRQLYQDLWHAVDNTEAKPAPPSNDDDSSSTVSVRFRRSGDITQEEPCIYIDVISSCYFASKGLSCLDRVLRLRRRAYCDLVRGTHDQRIRGWDLALLTQGLLGHQQSRLHSGEEDDEGYISFASMGSEVVLRKRLRGCAWAFLDCQVAPTAPLTGTAILVPKRPRQGIAVLTTARWNGILEDFGLLVDAAYDDLTDEDLGNSRS